MSKDNALAFVGQIMTAYKAIIKAEGSALEHAIECGKYLALAKENVEAARPKRKWSAWLAEHCPDIHRNTAALYMRLADPENADAIADCKSIREADVKLRQSGNGSCSTTTESPADSDSDESADEADDAQRVVQRTPASPDLAATLHDAAVDEVYSVLTEMWDREQLKGLVNRLLAYFREQTIPPVVQRPLATPAQPSQG
jgi:hypothetical protein